MSHKSIAKVHNEHNTLKGAIDSHRAMPITLQSPRNKFKIEICIACGFLVELWRKKTRGPWCICSSSSVMVLKLEAIVRAKQDSIRPTSIWRIILDEIFSYSVYVPFPLIFFSCFLSLLFWIFDSRYFRPSIHFQIVLLLHAFLGTGIYRN